MKSNGIAWMIGYFVALSPIHFAMGSTLIAGLIHSIIGVIGAIIFTEMRRRS